MNTKNALQNFLLTNFTATSILNLNIQEHLLEILVVILSSTIIMLIQIGFIKLRDFINRSNMTDEQKKEIIKELDLTEKEIKELFDERNERKDKDTRGTIDNKRDGDDN